MRGYGDQSFQTVGAVDVVPGFEVRESEGAQEGFGDRFVGCSEGGE